MEPILNLLEFNTKIQYPVIFTLLGVYFLLLWGSLVVYVWKNSRLYCGSGSSFPRGFFILITILFGFGGLLIYFLFRGDSVEQERLFSIEEGLLQREYWLCPECSATVTDSEHFCVNCGFATKKKCKGCGDFNQLENKYCRSCGQRFLLIQINDIPAFDRDYTRTSMTRKKLDELSKKLRSEMKNLRNFKMEPSLASLFKQKRSKNSKIRQKRSKNNKTQKSAKNENPKI